MTRISSSRRCKLFEKIADDTWNKIIRNHRTGNQAREIGITSDLVSEIEDNRLSYPNIGVWAREALNEPVDGNDIDIFVETKPGVFVWWALQAKVLHSDGTYHNLSRLASGSQYQWDKLNRLSSRSGCIVRYLFYNGVDNFHYNGNDICSRRFNQNQFGCSLVKINDVERISLTKRNPTFHDFHPNLADPWRIITCCLIKLSSFSSLTLYSLEQIKTSIEDYSYLTGPENILGGVNVTGDTNDFGINAIDSFSSNLERFSKYRLVIRSTESLYKG